MRFHLPSAIVGAAAVLIGILLVGIFATPRAETWIVGSLASYHFDRNGQNEKNLGAGIERRLDSRWGLVAGAYNNSSGDLTLYGGATRALWRAGPMHLRAMAAAATGYEKPLIVIPAAVVSFEGRHAGLNVGLIPAAGGVLFLQVKFPLR